VDLGERPELRSFADEVIGANLPDFMAWESPGNWRWHRIHGLFPRYQVCAVDEDGRFAGVLNALPVRWSGEVAELPAGYDEVLTSVVDGDGAVGARHTCLLSISVVAEHRRSGLAEALLADARDRAAKRGHDGILAPVRPTAKHRYPLIPIADYAAWLTADGEAFDPWLRVHLNAGAAFLGVAERSMVVRQPVERWEEFTGFAMPGPGGYPVAGALAPVVRTGGFATYAEPNIWVLHPT
jgi:GNAT superfamily N-acetyltransferase